MTTASERAGLRGLQPRPPALVGVIASALLLVVSLSACDAPENAGPLEENPSPDDVESAQLAYRVVLANAISDTLTGRAGFGTVLEPETGLRRFVIRLETGYDFAGGIVIARRNTALPEPGTYELNLPPDSLTGAPENAFTMFYREGMLRNLYATSGTLVISSATDTLIVGRLDAILEGVVARLDRESGDATVRAVGRFNASRNLDGYIIGL